MEEEEETQVKVTKNIFNKSIEENFPILKKKRKCLPKYRKYAERQIDCTRKKIPLAHSNQNTKQTGQGKNNKSCKGKGLK